MNLKKEKSSLKLKMNGQEEGSFEKHIESYIEKNEVIGAIESATRREDLNSLEFLVKYVVYGGRAYKGFFTKEFVKILRSVLLFSGENNKKICEIVGTILTVVIDNGKFGELFVGNRYQNAFKSAAEKGDFETTNLLLQTAIDHGKFDELFAGYYYKFAFKFAARSGNFETTNLLLQIVIDNGTFDKLFVKNYYQDALKFAAEKGDFKTTNLLLQTAIEKGKFDELFAGNYYQNALKSAAESGDFETTNLLLQTAIVKEKFDELFLDNSYQDALGFAAGSGDFETTNLLLQTAIDKEKFDELFAGNRYQMALGSVAGSGNFEITNLLLQTAIDHGKFDELFVGNSYQDALIFAAGSGDFKTTNLLLQTAKNKGRFYDLFIDNRYQKALGNVCGKTDKLLEQIKIMNLLLTTAKESSDLDIINNLFTIDDSFELENFLQVLHTILRFRGEYCEMINFIFKIAEDNNELDRIIASADYREIFEVILYRESYKVIKLLLPRIIDSLEFFEYQAMVIERIKSREGCLLMIDYLLHMGKRHFSQEEFEELYEVVKGQEMVQDGVLDIFVNLMEADLKTVSTIKITEGQNMDEVREADMAIKIAKSFYDKATLLKYNEELLQQISKSVAIFVIDVNQRVVAAKKDVFFGLEEVTYACANIFVRGVDGENVASIAQKLIGEEKAKERDYFFSISDFLQDVYLDLSDSDKSYVEKVAIEILEQYLGFHNYEGFVNKKIAKEVKNIEARGSKIEEGIEEDDAWELEELEALVKKVQQELNPNSVIEGEGLSVSSFSGNENSVNRTTSA